MSRPGPPKKNDSGAPPVPFKKLYTFATNTELFMVVLSCLAAVVGGTVLPLFALVFGSALDILNDPTSSIVESVSKLALYFLLIAIGAGFLSLLQVSLVVLSSERQMKKLRSAYVKALLYLDATWYDTHRAGEAVARLAEATITISTGMEKLPSIFQYTATLITGLVVGFTTSWKLSLVIVACAPLFAIALSILIITAISAEKKERNAYARAGDAANETFSLIRSIAAYGGELHESSRYLVFLRAAEKAGIRKGVGIGIAVGLMLVSFYAMYGISTWAGAQFVIKSREDMPMCRFYPNTEGCFSGGDIITTFVSVLLGALSFGQIGPLFGNLAAARAAATDIYGIIDAKPAIISKPNGYTGKKDKNDNDQNNSSSSSSGVVIQFRNVTFAYPSRPDVQVLKNFNLTIQPGETIGIAGSSGSGKSTLSLLILRAYDPQEGEVLVDGVSVKDWDLFSLRSMIGLVQQDPVLFGVTVGENIGMGKPAYQGTATTEEIQQAAKAANAEHFILNLPQKYDTMAGTGVSGSALSGGQRQRICIARAIIRQPRLLLLDEATSALDTQSERIVQAALDNLSSSSTGNGRRTTIQVAHRLSTLVRSDRILVMQHGIIVEEGSPTELLNKPDGIFRTMKAAQDIADPTKTKNDTMNNKDEGLTDLSEAGTDSSKVTDEAAIASMDSKSTDLVIRVVDKEISSTSTVSKATVAPVASARSVNLRQRIWALQKEDFHILALGILGAMGSGCIQPIVSIVYGDIIAIYFIPSDDIMKEKSVNYLGWFFLLGAGSFVGVLCRVTVFTYLGERLTRKLRSLVYGAILRQPQSFFDQQENSVGRLGTRLATDASLVKGATGDALGSFLEATGAIICAIVIAFIASWRLALVLMIVFPFLIIGSVYEFRSVAQVSQGSNKSLEDAGNSVAEAVTAIRTVTAYNLQTPTLKIFDNAIEFPYKAGVRRAFVQGSGQGFQRLMLMCAYSLAFYAGSRFIELGWLQFPELIRTFLAVTLAAEAVGRISSQAPDTAKADTAARAIFALIDLGNNSPIDPLSTKGVNPLLTVTDGTSTTGLKIEFRNVTFAYPTRPDVLVLKQFNLLIRPGETVGIVGSSGSGKSTLSLLIQRAYDPQIGEVLVNDVNVKDWNLAALRATIGLVQQEPALFADSIAYNIAYGTSSTTKMASGLGAQPKETSDNSDTKKDDNKDDKTATKTVDTVVNTVIYPPPSPDVIEAATYSNAVNFINDLPDGFATYCGSKGGQLSGGQKQRVAIARSLLRKPRLLLLDEATSALDSQSEKIVQEALDKILAESKLGSNGSSSNVGRTSLVIAHRLSTLANTDRIIVLDKGKVVESGSHNELMNITDGHYRNLALAQQGTT